MRSPQPITAAGLMVLVATLFGTLLVAVNPAVAAEGAVLGIVPGDEADYFHVELLPGGKSERTAVVSNRSTTVQEVAIYPADGVTTPQGGFSVKSEEDARTEVGAWVHLPMTTLTLAAGEQRLVNFDITVPLGTTPGDYSGGIVVQSQPRVGETTQLGKKTAVQLNIIERVAARIYLRVAGTAQPSLSVGSLTTSVDGSGRSFSLTINNTGNMRLQPSGQLRIDGLPGSPVTLQLSAVDTLLPGQQVTLLGRWTDPPTIFWGQVTATIQSEAGTANARMSLRLVPGFSFAITVALLIALILAVTLTVRFLRRARSALRSVARRPQWRWRRHVQPLGEPLRPVHSSPGQPQDESGAELTKVETRV